MISFFFWLLIKIVVLVTVGYFINKLITDTREANKLDSAGNYLQQTLIANAYQNLHPDIELANKINGLNIHRQRYPLYQKPVFYFKLEKNTSKKDIDAFLQSLPEEFEVCIPALKISIEDSELVSVYFWKHLDHFQLAIKKNGLYTLLGTLQIESLTEKVIEQSASFNFQNVTVERLIIS